MELGPLGFRLSLTESYERVIFFIERMGPSDVLDQIKDFGPKKIHNKQTF